MVHKEVARYKPKFGDLEVEVVASKWYFPFYVKKDNVSKRIVFSKKNDYSQEFWPDIESCFHSLNEKFDLICVIPASEVGVYSPTLVSLANMISIKFGIPFDNIILRAVKPIMKMADCKTAKDRYQFHNGTFALVRNLKSDEKTILLLDDIKAEGDTKLLCAELLTKKGAKTVKCICLGINTSDISKNNGGD